MLLIGRESHTSWPLWFQKNTLLTGENNTPNAAFSVKTCFVLQALSLECLRFFDQAMESLSTV